MRSLPLNIILLFLSLGSFAQPTQSPHGPELKFSCSDCHHPDGWKMIKGKYSFEHKLTAFPLVGQHASVDCRSCHQSLEFKKAETDCVSCHTDIHQQTVGFDCARCHTPTSWLVNNITQIHQISRFPLTGPHTFASCTDCHKSASNLQFEPLGVDCYDCHQSDYTATTSPNHIESDYSTNCIECHNINAFTWSGAGVSHNFFPLSKGHEINDCNKCHIPGSPYNSISPECVSCHEVDYQQTSNPNHNAVSFSTICNDCHTLDLDWKPAKFASHDGQFFPIYSGNHNDEWDNCAECHTTPNNYAAFSCIDCHEHNKSDMDNEHDEVGGYVYNSQACFECHPTGSGENVFNHSLSNFPLTGAHNTVSCADCHTNSYAGTSSVCSDCHQEDFNTAANPNHVTLGLSISCADCHTTNENWEPATFANHNEFYVLNGAHQEIANNCFDCHEGNYIETQNLCYGCHTADYNQTTNPPHVAADFSTSCETCHTETAWSPATFDHDLTYFPIYTGKHQGEWEICIDCHTTPTNYAAFSCIICHEHNKPDTDDEHNGIGGYSYDSESCFACHPTGSGDDGFNHSLTQFPLTGSHTTVECISCHMNGYTGTSTSCSECHSQDYNTSVNPSHTQLSIPTDCALCHTTNANWEPANFPIHNEYYVLNGAHQTIANNCAECHEGNYNTTSNICFGCHEANYNQTTAPAHVAGQFPTDCAACHTETSWQPATFNHNLTQFPLTGAHTTTECLNCHSNGYNGTSTICSECHTSDFNQSTNPNHQSLGIPNTCETCHTTNPNWNPATFPIHNNYYVLQGAHITIANQCVECHNGNYNNTSNTCYGCHTSDYNQTNNPPHQSAQFPTDCEACHTQNVWDPSTFNHDQQYFPIYSGNHNNEWDLCADCHTNASNYAIFSCIDCHEHRQSAMANEHQGVSGYSWNSIACLNCHPTGNGDKMHPLKIYQNN